MELDTYKVMGSLCVVLLVLIGWRILNWIWIRPRKLEKFLRNQGFKGNSYRLLYGDMEDLAAARKIAKSKPINLSDDYLFRAAPTVFTAVNKHESESTEGLFGELFGEIGFMAVDMSKSLSSNKDKGLSNYAVTIGDEMPLCSFVTATTECNNFGTIRVPNKFHNLFGENLKGLIHIICTEGYNWFAEYSQQSQRIIGLEVFFKQHMVKQCSLIIFDYVGNSKFRVAIHNSCGMEVDFSNVSPGKCKRSFLCQSFKESTNVSGIDDLERDKSLALLKFNGFRNRSPYYTRSLDKYDFFKQREGLILKNDMLDLYKHWKDGDIINLILMNKRWKIEIKKIGDLCIFGPSWFKFIEDVDLVVGDFLVLRTVWSKHDVHVCIFRKEDMLDHYSSTDSELCSTTFFQFVNNDSLKHKEIVPPLLVDKFYGSWLEKLKSVQCGKRVYKLGYFNLSKVVVGFGEIFEDYAVFKEDTIFFRLTNDGEANMRIFRKDGMEVVYELKGGDLDLLIDHWLISDHWYINEVWDDLYYRVESSEDINLEEENIDASIDPSEVGNPEIALKFVEVLQTSHVDLRSHGVYLPKEFEQHTSNWNKDTKVLFRRRNESWNIGINICNGRKRFCSGWNAFIRANDLEKNDMVYFNLQDDKLTFVIEIERKRKMKK